MSENEQFVYHLPSSAITVPTITIPTIPTIPTLTAPQSLPTHLMHIKQSLESLGNKSPLILINLIPVKLLQRINTPPRNLRVKHILLLELAAVHGLVATLDLDSDGGLPLLANGQLFMVALDTGAGGVVLVRGVTFL